MSQEYPKDPTWNVNDFPLKQKQRVKIAKVGDGELAMKKSAPDAARPWILVIAEFSMPDDDGILAWVKHALFASPDLYTSLQGLELKQGGRFLPNDQLFVTAVTKDPWQWELETIPSGDEEAVTFDSFKDNMAAPTIAAVGDKIKKRQQKSAPASPGAPGSVASYGTLIQNHYILGAHLGYKQLRAEHPDMPEDTAEALQARAATANISDKNSGVDQIALVTDPDYPVANMEFVEAETKAEKTPPSEQEPAQPKDAGVTDDDIPF